VDGDSETLTRTFTERELFQLALNRAGLDDAEDYEHVRMLPTGAFAVAYQDLDDTWHVAVFHPSTKQYAGEWEDPARASFAEEDDAVAFMSTLTE